MRFLILPIFLSLLLAPVSAEAPGLRTNPADDLFELAELAYGEALGTKEKSLQLANYQVAARQFARFLEHHGDHPKALEALYYSASCHDKLGQEAEGAKCRQRILKNWKSGQLVGLSALQLASYYYYSEKDFEMAASHYRKAIDLVDPLSAKQLAQYQLALSLQKSGKEKETITALEEVVKDGDSPYTLQAQKALAHYYQSSGKVMEAYELFLALMRNGNEETKAEATLQAALLSRELGNEQETSLLFKEVLNNESLQKWHAEARLFLMVKAAQEENYPEVLSLYSVKSVGLTKEQKIKQLLLAAQAYKQTQQEEQSLTTYRELAKIARSTKTGLEASYYILSHQYSKGSATFEKEARNFLTIYRKPFPDDPRVDNTRLMLAEATYRRENFEAAAKLYNEINLENLDAANHAEVRYRLMSALRSQGELSRASSALDEFYKHHPNDPRVAHALVQRGDSARSAGEFEEALKDYDLLLTLTSKEQLIEYAWVQKASIFKSQMDLSAMIKAHQKLLELFPERSPQASAASHFWIGWALFRQEQFQEALAPLNKARQLDNSTFGKEATVQLCLAHYSLEQTKELQREVDHLHQNHPTATLPQSLYAWLGVTLALDHKFAKAWKYLPHAVDWQQPSAGKNTTWLSYARSAQETGHHKESIRAYEYLLKGEENPFRRADYLYEIARAHFSNSESEQALDCAQEALALKPQGGLNGKIRLLLGSIAASLGDEDSALQHYVVVVELYNEDADARHRALKAAIPILEQKGSPDDLAQAERYQKLLKTP